MLVSSDTILAIELAKIQNDFKGAFALEDDALVAKPSYFEKCEIYARDLILNTRPGIPLKSKLLDESFKVIYIDCTEFFPEKGQFLVRLPSPKMLNLMTKNLPSGELVYPRIADLMSRILDVCMDPRRSNLQLIGNIKRYRETSRAGGLIARYMTEVKQLLNTRENYMKTLIQPVCSGIAPKQMVDKFIPHGVCVVLNDRVYDSLKRKTWGELADEREDFYVLGLRNPVLWTAMMQRLTVWSAKQWDEHLQANHGVALDDYLCVEHCQHLMMMNIIDMLQPQADADGFN